MSAEPAVESQTYTVEEYFALDETSEVKHEFVHGRICAMAGGTSAHDRIANSVRTMLDSHLADGPCALFGPDMRVRVDGGVYYYPDALVTCDDVITDTTRDLHSPRLIVEVLAESTEANDRGEKFGNYQSLVSLQEYVLIDSRRMVVEIFRRNGALWAYRRFVGGVSVAFESVGLSCRVADLYRRTTVQPPTESKDSNDGE